MKLHQKWIPSEPRQRHQMCIVTAHSPESPWRGSHGPASRGASHQAQAQGKKIVADRWEFANEFFRKGAKHLLAEIHRRKSSQPPSPSLGPHQAAYHHHYHLGNTFSPPPPPPPPMAHHHHHPVYQQHFQEEPAAATTPNGGSGDFLAALSEDNRQLRRRNSLLLSELTHMKKLYNDIIYFLQNHVAPVTSPSSVASQQRHLPLPGAGVASSNSCRLLELDMDIDRDSPAAEDDDTVKLFGVALHHGKKKRAHHEERGSGDVVHGLRSEV